MEPGGFRSAPSGIAPPKAEHDFYVSMIAPIELRCEYHAMRDAEREPSSTEDLAWSAVPKDEKGYHDLVVSLLPVGLHFLAKRGLGPEAREDVAFLALAILCTKIKSGTASNRDDGFRRLYFTILLGLWVDGRRRAARRITEVSINQPTHEGETERDRASFADYEDPKALRDHYDRLDGPYIRDALDQALEALEPELLEVVEHLMLGTPAREIASILHIDVQEVYKRSRKARQVLNPLKEFYNG